MKKLQIKVVASLVFMLILSAINLNQYFLLVLMIGCYSLFKAMDLYHEMQTV